MALIVTETVITRIVDDPATMREAFGRMERTIIANDRGWSGQANYDRLPLRDDGAFSLLTHVSPSDGMSIRVFPADGTDSAPSDGATWLLFDSTNGRLVAIFSSALLSAMRTAIPSVACARVLATPGCRSIAVIGSGRQAQAHCRLLRAAFPDADALHLWSPTPDRRRTLARQARQWFDGEIRECGNRDDATQAADLIFLLGPPNIVQMSAEAAAPDAILVTLGNAVPVALLDRAKVVVPTLAMMNQPAPGTRRSSVAGVLRGETTIAGPTILNLGGLYGWDAAVARWAYEQVTERRLGCDLALC